MRSHSIFLCLAYLRLPTIILLFMEVTVCFAYKASKPILDVSPTQLLISQVPEMSFGQSGATQM